MGSFENAENIIFFVNFATRMFTEYGQKVKFWCTLNEPVVWANLGYFLGVFPPGKKDLNLTAEVYKNLMVAHVDTYHAIKKLPGGDSAKIGLAKNLNIVDPYNAWNPMDNLLKKALDRFDGDVFFEFMTTGRFDAPFQGTLYR
jgi:beta-glucosidase